MPDQWFVEQWGDGWSLWARDPSGSGAEEHLADFGPGGESHARRAALAHNATRDLSDADLESGLVAKALRLYRAVVEKDGEAAPLEVHRCEVMREALEDISVGLQTWLENHGDRQGRIVSLLTTVMKALEQEQP